MIGLCAAFFAWMSVTSADEPKPAKSSVVMEKKLEYAQDILKALMNEDFDRLERDVKLMKVFTRLEEMYSAKQPGYREQLTKFQTSVAALTTSVEAKNHETASQAYLNMVQSCIQCHKIIKHD
jgi:hypothetical protein